MQDSGGAAGYDMSDQKENQEKSLDMYFGVFFDVHEIDSWINFLGNKRKAGEQWLNDKENFVQDSKAMKIATIIEGTAKNIIEMLPDNPVSNLIQSGLDIKDTIVGYIDTGKDLKDKYTGMVDDAVGSVLNNEYVPIEDIDPLGSLRSIIFDMEPDYIGGLHENIDSFWSDYNYRIYAQGSVFTSDFKPKEDDEEEIVSPEFREFASQEAVDLSFAAIEDKVGMAPTGQKLSLHFDLFGYADDASIDMLKPKIDSLSHPGIVEICYDHIGKYKNLNDPDEVFSDLGGTSIRFRNKRFLEKND